MSERIGRYVSRGGLKLASVVVKMGVDFKGKKVLDVGSSTGGFSDFALQNGAQKVIAVEAGTGQMHPSLRDNPRLELHEKTDIKNFKLPQKPELVLVDVSFVSLREILPVVEKLSGKETLILALCKPQFETGPKDLNHGVIKNDSIRRLILKDFESWVKKRFVIEAKADSEIAGSKGNLERFYALRIKKHGVKM